MIATAIATNGGGHWKGNENGDGDANGNEKMNAIDCGNTIASCATGCGSWRCDCESATDSTCGYESGCFFSPRIWHWRRDQEQLRWLLLPPPLLLLLVLLLLLLLLILMMMMTTTKPMLQLAAKEVEALQEHAR